MITTVTNRFFVDTFVKSDTYKNQFSHEALNALFDYYEQLEDGTGEPIEFDMVAICCEWSEYDSLKEALSDYNDIKTLEDLQNNTTVIELDNGGLVIEQF